MDERFFVVTRVNLFYDREMASMSKWGQEWIETVRKVFGKYWMSNWQVIGKFLAGIMQAFGRYIFGKYLATFFYNNLMINVCCIFF